MEKIYRLASAAERDLLDILAYTNRQWGSAQAEKYVADIEACLEAIVKGRVRGKPFLVQKIKIFIWRCKSHYIFFWTEENRLMCSRFCTPAWTWCCICKIGLADYRNANGGSAGDFG